MAAPPPARRPPDASPGGERLLRLVLAAIPHVVWWKDRDLRYLGCNESYLALRGLDQETDLVGRTESLLRGSETLGAALTELERRALGTAGPVTGVRLVAGDPARTWQVTVLPCLEGGEPTGVVGVGTDISHVTELERRLAHAHRLESIGQLAAGIAYEITTPVQDASDNTRFVATTVAGVLAPLRELEALARDGAGLPEQRLRERLRAVVDELDLGFVAEEVPGALTQSLEGLDRVAQIVRAMKEYARPRPGRIRTDLNRLVTSTVQVSRNEWTYVADLTVDLDPAVGLVSCFESDLKQVVLGVIVNAAQAVAERRQRQGRREPGRIVVSTRRDGEDVRITVTDDGIGMDDATRRRVFDPFFTTRDSSGAVGQGMTLAHATVVNEHHGRIEVASELGRGSQVTIVLPGGRPSSAGARGGGPGPAAGSGGRG